MTLKPKRSSALAQGIVANIASSSKSTLSYIITFEFRSAWLVGLTPIGRATVSVLAMNETRRLELRALLLAEGELT
jgi:hypothetical protein